MTISDVRVENDPSSDFAITSTTCTGVALAPKGKCQVSVTFTARAPGARAGILRFIGTGSQVLGDIPLSGVGDTPTMAVNPGVGTGGQVVEIAGANFPPGQPITVGWAIPTGLLTTGFPEPSRTVTVGADGTFTLELPTFRKTLIGTRAAVATVGVFTANAPFLVVLPTAQPADFVIRS